MHDFNTARRKMALLREDGHNSQQHLSRHVTSDSGKSNVLSQCYKLFFRHDAVSSQPVVATRTIDDVRFTQKSSMTRAQAQEIAAALMDIKGWLRELGDALIVLSVLLVTGLALLNVLRAGAA